jgi:hypothetical protein
MLSVVGSPWFLKVSWPPLPNILPDKNRKKQKITAKKWETAEIKRVPNGFLGDPRDLRGEWFGLCFTNKFQYLFSFASESTTSQLGLSKIFANAFLNTSYGCAPTKA